MRLLQFYLLKNINLKIIQHNIKLFVLILIKNIDILIKL